MATKFKVLEPQLTNMSRWAPTLSRTRMMAAVFLMQPVGQLAAQLVGLFVLIGYNRSYGLQNCTDPNMHASSGGKTCGAYVDGIWRWVTGVGAIPALFAIGFRFLITDPGLYDLDVKDRGERAVRNTEHLYPDVANRTPQQMPLLQTTTLEIQPVPVAVAAEEPLRDPFSREDIRAYFWDQGNWRYLLGTSTCWFLVDFAFYGLGIGGPRTLAKIWTPPSRIISKTAPTWEVDPSQPKNSIYGVLEQAAKQNIITVCIGSLLGSIFFVLLADRIPRKHALIGSFILLAALFALTGITFFFVFHTDGYVVTIILVGFCYFVFNLGKS